MASRVSPPVQLRERLARLRAGGVNFGAAWTVALRGMEWNNGTDRHVWIAAFEETRESWQAAYEGEDAGAGIGGLLAALDGS